MPPTFGTVTVALWTRFTTTRTTLRSTTVSPGFGLWSSTMPLGLDGSSALLRSRIRFRAWACAWASPRLSPTRLGIWTWRPAGLVAAGGGVGAAVGGTRDGVGTAVGAEVGAAVGAGVGVAG